MFSQILFGLKYPGMRAREITVDGVALALDRTDALRALGSRFWEPAARYRYSFLRWRKRSTFSSSLPILICAGPKPACLPRSKSSSSVLWMRKQSPSNSI